MAHVSLIVLDRRENPTPLSRMISWRDALADSGHSVDLIIVGRSSETDTPTGARLVTSRDVGRSTDAFDGLHAASGDLFLIVDGSRAFPAADIVGVMVPLAEGRAQVAVADGKTTGWRKLVVTAMRPLTGSDAPFSSLIGLTRESFQSVEPVFNPVGHRFSLEILSRIRQGRTDVKIVGDGISGATTLHFDDIRHAKRLADDNLGNLSRLLQFCVVGASGMVVDLTCYAIFQRLFAGSWLASRPPLFGSPLDLVAAGSLSIALALVWNFTLNRRLTFNYAKQGPVFSQFVTYVLSNALGIALSLTLRLALPRTVGFFARHKLAAAVLGIVAATGISFSMSRWVVFRPRSAQPQVKDAISATAVPAQSA